MNLEENIEKLLGKKTLFMCIWGYVLIQTLYFVSQYETFQLHSNGILNYKAYDVYSNYSSNVLLKNPTILDFHLYFPFLVVHIIGFLVFKYCMAMELVSNLIFIAGDSCNLNICQSK